MKNEIDICYSRSIENNFKSFNATFDPERQILVLPSYLIDALEEAANRKMIAPITVFSVLYTCPTHIAQLLGWNVEDMVAATAELAELLKGHIPDCNRLPNAGRPVAPYGANDPKEK